MSNSTMVTAIDVGAISFGSILQAGTDLRAQQPAVSDLGPAMAAALELSPTRAVRLVRGIIATADDVEQSAVEVGSLVEWAARAGIDQRRVLIDAVRTSGGDVLLVDRMSRLPRTEARPFLAEYLGAGGRRRDIAIWLATVGGVLREHGRLDDNHSGAVVGWVVGAAEAVVDALSEAVETIVDALIKAGETIADVINEIADFTREQMENLVEALLAAGETIANLVAEAANATVAVFRKTIRAMLDIGTTIAHVLRAVATEAAHLVRDTISALRDIGRSFLSILRDAATLAASVFKEVISALLDIGRAVVDLLGDAVAAAGAVLAATLRALLAIGRSVATLLGDVVTGRVTLMDAVTRALRDIGHSVTTLLEQARTAVAGALRAVAASLARIGERIVDLATWAAEAVVEFRTQVVAALMDVGNTIVDLVEAVARSARTVMRAIIEGFYAIGRTLEQLLSDLVGIGGDLLATVLEAAFAVGTTLADFVDAAARATYQAGARLVRAALKAGAAVGDLLAHAAAGTYFTLRRMVYAVLDAVGLREVFDWALSQFEDGVSAVFRDVVLAVRFAGGALTDALEWALHKSEEVFQAMVDAWESVGEKLRDLYEWASNVAADMLDAVWERLGRITSRLRNSVTYVLNHLEKRFLPGARPFIRGLMEAGYALARLLARVLHRATEFVAEAVAALESAGVTLAAVLRGAAARGNVGAVLAGTRRSGSTWDDIMRAAEEAGEDVAADVAHAAHELDEALEAMLDAAWGTSASVHGVVVSALLRALPTHRALTGDEKAEARKVFRNALDLDNVAISQEPTGSTIITEVQAAFHRLGADAPIARAFVPGTLINLRATPGSGMEMLIHELTHVWQDLEPGPIHLSETLHAHITPETWNYGYTDGATGTGAEEELRSAGGDFGAFTPEQQCQILQHYYRRRFVESPALDTTNWQPYVDLVGAP